MSTAHSGSSVNSCKSIALKALKVNDSACTHMKCTFGGIWNGGGGDGQKNLFVASFFFDRAAEVIIVLSACLTHLNLKVLIITNMEACMRICKE